MLIPKRVRDTLIIFFKFFNFGSDFKYNGIPVNDLLPYLSRDIARAINSKPEKAEVLITWLSEAIFYCRGDQNYLPDFEVEFKL